ncbi:helix-turn-helix domain-containing protein [Kocuria dechangensis]|uniref:AraC-like ligand-binding domain-containing protein n=1 Tax=Kocuria dechangensis TaxID=1176249 RepID=UPI00280B1693|nr:helix-turn-helix domain-containing protein [Kocuria dechangensis]
MEYIVVRTKDPVAESAVGGASWRFLVTGSLLPFEMDLSRREEFSGTIRSSRLSELSFIEMACQMHAAHRSVVHVSEVERPELVVSFQRSGTLHLEQDGRRTKISPGQFAVYDSSRPVALVGSDDYRSLCIKFPMAHCRDGADSVREITATSFDGGRGLGPAVWGMLENLGAGVRTGPPRNPGRVAHNVIGLVEQMLHEQLDHREAGEASEVLLNKCLRYIDDHLGDPELSPQQVAAANFISTRYLHVLFQRTDTTVASHIREVRLQRVREDLADLRYHTASVDSIARRWGFTNISHFGQTFKKATGETPAGYRRSMLSGGGLG